MERGCYSLSELELAVSDLYSGKDGKNKAIAYFLSHQGSDLLAAAWSETWYHLRSIESWVDGLSMTFVMKGMFENLAKSGIQYTKSSLKLGQKMHKAYKAGMIGKEFRLPSGRRIDFLDIKNSTVYE